MLLDKLITNSNTELSSAGERSERKSREQTMIKPFNAKKFNDKSESSDKVQAIISELKKE